jgi:hypothetical protein
MNHFQWAVTRIEDTAALGGAGVQALLDALLSLQGHSESGMIFGMSRSALDTTTEERGRLVERIRKALLRQRDAFARENDNESLLELSKASALPELQFQLTPQAHPQAPWLQHVLAGVFVLRNCDLETATLAARMSGTLYEGPDMGGLDVIEPNDAQEAWILLGRWTECFQPEVHQAAISFFKGLRTSVKSINDGIALTQDGNVTTLSSNSGGSHRHIEVVEWHLFNGMLSPRTGPLSEEDIQRLTGTVFPSLPHWVGMHRGAPHWLGLGVSESDGRIHGVSPYVRLDFPGDGRVELSALASEADFQLWLQPFLEAMLEVAPPAAKSDVNHAAAAGTKPWWKFWNKV